MKKKVLTMVIASSLFVSMVPFYDAIVQASSQAEVVRDVNFRSEPSLSDNRIRYLQDGEKVDVIEKVNDYWYKIRDSRNRIGYVTTKKKYVQLLSSSGSSSETNATIEWGVSFRTGPSTDNKRIRYLQKGERVNILEQVNSYWYKVKDLNGDIGYASTNSRYINPDTNKIDTNNWTSPSSETNASVVQGVSFRTGPSTDNRRMRYLQKGESISILEQTNRYWYKVKDRNGTVGFVSSSDRYIDTSYRFTDNSNDYGNQSSSVLAQKVINAGMEYMGTPYEFGSNRYNTRTFDCSDFVRQAFLDGIGLKLPMDSRKQGQYVKNLGNTTTNWRNLKPGDIMFFMSYKGFRESDYNGINKSNQRITHNGIYLGNGKILHTYSKEAGGVKIDSVDAKNWENRFLFGGSPIQ
jgi:cell wall-associated NlpC family hydrolase